jgi:hypothetical protein
MAKPRLYFGLRGAAALVEGGVGFRDNGVAYNLLAKTARLAPGGPAGECIFTALYLTVVHFANVAFTVTPIIDEVAQPSQELQFIGLDPLGGPFTEAHRKVETVELGLSVPYVYGGIEQLRTYPRGTWIEVLVQTALGIPTFLRIDELEVEHEVVVAPARPVGILV